MARTDGARSYYFGVRSAAQTPEAFIQAWQHMKETQQILDTGQRHTLDAAEYEVEVKIWADERIRSALRLFLIVNLMTILFFWLALPFSEVFLTLRLWTITMTAVAMIICFSLTASLCLSLLPPKEAKEYKKKPNK